MTLDPFVLLPRFVDAVFARRPWLIALLIAADVAAFALSAGCTSSETAAPKLRTLASPIEDTGGAASDTGTPDTADTGTTTPVDTSTDTETGADTSEPADTAPDDSSEPPDTSTDTGVTDTGTAPPDPCAPHGYLYLTPTYYRDSGASPGTLLSAGFDLRGGGTICAISCTGDGWGEVQVGGTVQPLPTEIRDGALYVLWHYMRPDGASTTCTLHTSSGDLTATLDSAP